MEHPIENTDTELKTITLSHEEKAAMRSHIVSFMHEHPLPTRSDAWFGTPSDAWYGIKSPLRTPALHMVRVTLGTLLLVATVGGSLATAAERSLPGDILYSVKVNVTEEVRSVIAVSSKNQAVWAAERAHRRLEEVEKLAVEGRLDGKVSRTLERKFEQHAEKSLALAEESDDFEVKANVHADLEATLEAHKTALGTLIETNEDLDEKLKDVRTVVTKKAEASEDARRAAEKEQLSASSTIYSLALLEKRKKIIEDKIEDVDDAYDEVRKLIDRKLAREISDLIEDAEHSYDRAERFLDKEELGRAVVEFQETLRVVKEAEVLLSISIVLMPKPQEDVPEDTATTTDDAATTSDTATVEGAATTTAETATSTPAEAASTSETIVAELSD
jgi:hypothetical protein